MEEIIKNTLRIIEHWGVFAQIIGIIAVLFFSSLALLKDFRKAVIEILKENIGDTSSEPLKHPFFLQKELLLSQIEKMDFKDKDKNWLFRTLLTIKVNTTYRLITEYVKNESWKKIKKVELQTQLLILIDSIPKQYEQAIMQAYMLRYGLKGSQIFNIVYWGDEGFFQYHIKNIEHIQHNTRKIVIVEGFDNKEVLNSFLLQVWIALDVAITDCVLTFYNLNGNLKKALEETNETTTEKEVKPKLQENR